MTSGNQNGFPTVFAFALVTLLSCFSPVSSYFFLPRVTRTNDAIIIDYEGVGYSPFSLGRGYGQFVDPGFVPLPAFNPYGMVQQPQPMFYGGLSHFGRQAAPAATCGRGPPQPLAPPTRTADLTADPTKTAKGNRTVISERVDGDASTVGLPGRTWPFLVVLKQSMGGGGNNGIFFCSGTLISDTRVLLAAQCMERLSLFEISTVTVLVGMTSITADETVFRQMTRRISRVVIHSQYNSATYANDIAIITLDMPVVFSLRVAPACLPTASTDPDQYVDRDAAVMGWGAAGGGMGIDFFQGPVTIVANDLDCRSQPSYGSFVTVNNICISGETFTCPTDTGGPVVLNTAAPGATVPIWTVVGINSFAKDDCSETGLKTRVSAYAAWIAQFLTA